jgi:hypothetical protein
MIATRDFAFMADRLTSYFFGRIAAIIWWTAV